jgi:ATP-dependent Lon protease
MTGEITLRGRILPVGGIKEKVLAAHRVGILNVIVPSKNKPDLMEVPQKARKQLNFILVDHMNEVLETALLPAEPRSKSRPRRKPSAKERTIPAKKPEGTIGKQTPVPPRPSA